MGASLLFEKMDGVWERLEREAESEGLRSGRKYKRLDLGKEKGFRLSWCLPEGAIELLIQLDVLGGIKEYEFPEWRGMRFEVLVLDAPRDGTFHLSLKLEDRDLRDVFISLCADLADDLEKFEESTREAELAAFLERWTRFFERNGFRGLSPEKQRGLFGELIWLKSIINEGFGNITSLAAWKGCERAYHDFDLGGHIVEVKTTMTKEPRKVRISNERQLDDRGLLSLHLFVLSLVKSSGGGQTLQDIVDSIKKEVSGTPGGIRRFDKSLKSAGYLEVHAHRYTDTYAIRHQELFKVEEGFPRITDLPAGIGDIKYSLLVSSANKHSVNIEEYLALMKGGKQ